MIGKIRTGAYLKFIKALDPVNHQSLMQNARLFSKSEAGLIEVDLVVRSQECMLGEGDMISTWQDSLVRLGQAPDSKCVIS